MCKCIFLAISKHRQWYWIAGSIWEFYRGMINILVDLMQFWHKYVSLAWVNAHELWIVIFRKEFFTWRINCRKISCKVILFRPDKVSHLWRNNVLFSMYPQTLDMKAFFSVLLGAHVCSDPMSSWNKEFAPQTKSIIIFFTHQCISQVLGLNKFTHGN